MALNDARAGWIVGLTVAGLSIFGSIVAISANAGSLENRVSSLEVVQGDMAKKIYSIADDVAWIKGSMEQERKKTDGR